MRKVVSLAVLFAAVSMLFLNAAAEIGIIESPNIDIIQMETEQLDEAWLYKHVEASPEDTYKELMKAIYIISSMQYGPYSNYEDVPSHDLSMDAITEWLDALSFEYELENTEFGACMRFSEQVSINFYLEEATIKRMELVGAEPVEIPERFPFYSLVNITGTARGITETGCKFPLDNGEIHCGYQYGTSNEVLPGQIAVVSVKEGLLLLIKDFPEV